MSGFEFSTCKRLINQPGSIEQLPDILRQEGIVRPLVVTDKGIVATGLLGRVEAIFAGSNIKAVIYDEVVADPPEKVILDALAVAKENDVDGVVGFGGGSPMDTAKLVALLLGSSEDLGQVYGVDQAKGPRLPLILVPTTAGTGSEVTPISIVTTGADTKTGVVSRLLIPDAAILDAELTLDLPASVTASTGVDAMVHAIEAYTSKIKKNPYSDMLACQALELLSSNLLIAIKEPSNLSARQNMLYGACLAGQAFANAPVAAVHALAYPLGGQFHISHGLSNALVLPWVLRFNLESAHQLYARLATHTGIAVNSSDSEEAAAEQFIAGLEIISQRSGLPQRLRDLNIPESALEGLAEDAMKQERLLINNPRVLGYDDALAIYRLAY